MFSEKFGWQPIDMAPIDKDVMMIVTDGQGEPHALYKPFKLTAAQRRVVQLRAPDYTFDPAALEAAITPRTRVLLLNSPHNPTGKVFAREELELIARLCVERDLVAITDEVYEHLVFDGEHIPLATLPGMRGPGSTTSRVLRSISSVRSETAPNPNRSRSPTPNRRRRPNGRRSRTDESPRRRRSAMAPRPCRTSNHPPTCRTVRASCESP